MFGYLMDIRVDWENISDIVFYSICKYLRPRHLFSPFLDVDLVIW